METTTAHIGLNVTDVYESQKFYEALFNQKATKSRDDYAKFEVDGLVLSFYNGIPQPNTAHFGLRLPDTGQVISMLERVKNAGLETEEQEGVRCCYALQDKFWVTDPDGYRWEFYTFLNDVEQNDEKEEVCCTE